MTWANNGQIDLESPISKWLPHAPKDVRIVDCLSHSSGYPNWRPFYSTHRRNQEHWGSPEVRESFLNRVVSTPLNGTPTVSYAYSDIGFMALCAVAEARFGKAIHVLWQEFLPTEARDGLFWGHPNAAATEDCPIRGRVIKGEVHDLNAAVLGGKSTHAGLFGTASTLTKVGSWPLQGLHGRTEHLESQTVRYFWGTKGAGSHCLGWDTPSPSGSTASNYWPKRGLSEFTFYRSSKSQSVFVIRCELS